MEVVPQLSYSRRRRLSLRRWCGICAASSVKWTFWIPRSSKRTGRTTRTRCMRLCAWKASRRGRGGKPQPAPPCACRSQAHRAPWSHLLQRMMRRKVRSSCALWALRKLVNNVVIKDVGSFPVRICLIGRFLLAGLQDSIPGPGIPAQPLPGLALQCPCFSQPRPPVWSIWAPKNWGLSRSFCPSLSCCEQVWEQEGEAGVIWKCQQAVF